MKRDYFQPIGEAIAEFFDAREAELLDMAERHGPIAGPIRPAQRPYSDALDGVLEARETDCEPGWPA